MRVSGRGWRGSVRALVAAAAIGLASTSWGLAAWAGAQTQPQRARHAPPLESDP